MARRVAYLAVPALVVLSTVLSSCALFKFERRAEWRGDAEQACMAARGELERQIQAGERAMRKLILCETIATTRK